MNKGIIKIGIIGAGRVAQHYKFIIQTQKLTNFEIVGICDTNIKSAEYLAKHFNCVSFIDLKTMINECNPNLVIILTPSGLHYIHAKISLEMGCNVLVEKPVTMLPKQAYELKSIASNKNLMICVAFQNRLNPSIQCLKSAIDNNKFGKITTATVRLRWCRYQNYYEDEWHGTWNQDGGVINQQAIHHVDALNWLVGPIESVSSRCTNRLNKLEAEDTFVAIINFKNSSLGTIEATTAARPKDIEASLSIIGELGSAVIGGVALNKIETWEFINQEEDKDALIKNYSTEVPNGYGLSHGPLLQMVIDSLISGSIEAPIPIDECISTCELVHSLYVSHETSSWVRLEDKLVSTKLGASKINGY